jgi:hypothetical protein
VLVSGTVVDMPGAHDAAVAADPVKEYMDRVGIGQFYEPFKKHMPAEKMGGVAELRTTKTAELKRFAGEGNKPKLSEFGITVRFDLGKILAALTKEPPEPQPELKLEPQPATPTAPLRRAQTAPAGGAPSPPTDGTPDPPGLRKMPELDAPGEEDLAAAMEREGLTEEDKETLRREGVTTPACFNMLLVRTNRLTIHGRSQ